MKAKRTVVSILALASCALMPLCGLDTVRTVLPSAPAAVVYPVDATIGQTCPATASPAHQLLWQALKTEYSYEWTMSYLADDVRAALERMYGPWLSENLPCPEVLMSTSHVNGDGSIGINVRLPGSCMGFVLQGDRIIAMSPLADR